jgi:hypothetical protein
MSFMENAPPALGSNFAPKNDSTDGTFTVTGFRYLLNTGAVPSIAHETAHRRNATYPDFMLTPANIVKCDVRWQFGYKEC